MGGGGGGGGGGGRGGGLVSVCAAESVLLVCVCGAWCVWCGVCMWWAVWGEVGVGRMEWASEGEEEERRRRIYVGEDAVQ